MSVGEALRLAGACHSNGDAQIASSKPTPTQGNGDSFAIQKGHPSRRAVTSPSFTSPSLFPTALLAVLLNGVAPLGALWNPCQRDAQPTLIELMEPL